MQNAAEYLDKTRSAAAKLFEGIDSYLMLLRKHPTTFVSSYTSKEDYQKKFDAWKKENHSQIQAGLEAQKEYLGESFAQATLCGSILQIAAKAIECYSNNTHIPEEWTPFIRPGNKAVAFCTGKLIRGVPLGLVIYAARNQHTHFEDQAIREPNVEVFRRLASNYGNVGISTNSFVDPAFDLGTKSITSFANNITALINWRSLQTYEADMRELLQIEEFQQMALPRK